MNIEQLLEIDDTHARDVHVPEWNATIKVASMTAMERAEIEKRWSQKKAASDPAGFRRDVLELTLKRDDGTPLGTAEQIQMLMHKSASAIERLVEAAFEVNGFTKKDVEELEKN